MTVYIPISIPNFPSSLSCANLPHKCQSLNLIYCIIITTKQMHQKRGVTLIHPGTPCHGLGVSDRQWIAALPIKITRTDITPGHTARLLTVAMTMQTCSTRSEGLPECKKTKRDLIFFPFVLIMHNQDLDPKKYYKCYIYTGLYHHYTY